VALSINLSLHQVHDGRLQPLPDDAYVGGYVEDENFHVVETADGGSGEFVVTPYGSVAYELLVDAWSRQLAKNVFDLARERGLIIAVWPAEADPVEWSDRHTVGREAGRSPADVLATHADADVPVGWPHPRFVSSADELFDSFD
jgi:hypothetical protein